MKRKIENFIYLCIMILILSNKGFCKSVSNINADTTPTFNIFFAIIKVSDRKDSLIPCKGIYQQVLDSTSFIIQLNDGSVVQRSKKFYKSILKLPCQETIIEIPARYDSFIEFLQKDNNNYEIDNQFMIKAKKNIKLLICDEQKKVIKNIAINELDKVSLKEICIDRLKLGYPITIIYVKIIGY